MRRVKFGGHPFRQPGRGGAAVCDCPGPVVQARQDMAVHRLLFDRLGHDSAEQWMMILFIFIAN